jgi:hypothetical protein
MLNANQILANAVYRGVARLTGQILGTSEIVESVFAHRSVGSGEISFGRSDIDLVMVVRQPNSDGADGSELASLYEKVCRIRRFNPAVKHMAVQDPRGVKTSVETDTYLASLDRRGSVLLYGKPVEMPEAPVRQEDALRRFAFPLEGNLTTAVRMGDGRNLRKIAADMWNAYAVAMGILPVPFLTRKQAEAHWSATEDAGFPAEVARDPERGLFHGFQLAKRLHDELLPPLEPLREPFVFEARMAPRFRGRSFVIVPGTGFRVPAGSLEPHSFLSTPELLHLYVHYVNPFFDWVLPSDLRRLGFSGPTPREFVRACLFHGHSHTTRNPGFMHHHTAAPATTIALLKHSAGYLRNGETPPPMLLEDVDAIAQRPPALLEYYREDFAQTYRQSEELWLFLNGLDARLRSLVATAQ